MNGNMFHSNKKLQATGNGNRSFAIPKTDCDVGNVEREKNLSVAANWLCM